jgi:hypothetical protein
MDHNGWLAIVVAILAGIFALAGALGGQKLARGTEHENQRHERQLEAARWRRQRGKELANEKRQRLEQLYQLLEDVGASYGANVANAAISLLTQTIENRQEATVIQWSKMQMLVHFYFPDMGEALARVQYVGQERLSRCIVNAWDSRQKDRETRDKASRILMAAHQELESIIDSIRSAVVAESQRLAARDQQDLTEANL